MVTSGGWTFLLWRQMCFDSLLAALWTSGNIVVDERRVMRGVGETVEMEGDYCMKLVLHMHGNGDYVRRIKNVQIQPLSASPRATLLDEYLFIGRRSFLTGTYLLLALPF
jgi:hypothetical protein